MGVKPPSDSITVNTSRPQKWNKNDLERRTKITKLQYLIKSQKVEIMMYIHKLEVIQIFACVALYRINIIHDTLTGNLERGNIIRVEVQSNTKDEDAAIANKSPILKTKNTKANLIYIHLN